MTADTQWRLFWTLVFLAITPILFVRDVFTHARRLGPITAACISVMASAKTLDDIWRKRVL